MFRRKILGLIALCGFAAGAHAQCSDSVSIINNVELPPVIQGIPYYANLFVDDVNNPTITWMGLQSGALPSGLTVSGNSISGTTTDSPGKHVLSIEAKVGNSYIFTSLCLEVISSSTPSWVYYQGVFDWAIEGTYTGTGGSLTFAANDTTGAPPSGTYDISLSGETFAAYTPVACNPITSCFTVSSYKNFTFAVEPSQSNANSHWGVYFVWASTGQSAEVIANCGGSIYTPTANTWYTCTVDLTNIGLGLASSSIEYFGIQDLSGISSNTFYLDNIGFY